MKNYRQQFVHSLFLTASLLVLASCDGGTASSSFGNDPTGGSGNMPVQGTSDGVTASTNFYVGVDALTNSIAHVHQESSFAAACSISPTDTNQAITCIVDAPEAEYLFNGLTLKYNAPVGMCRYLRRSTYWFYNHEIGVGPTSIVINRTYNGSGDLTAATCNVDGGGVGPCVGFSEVSIDASKPAPDIKCVYDKSSAALPNCCLGTYSLSVTDTKAGIPSSNVETRAWGGNVRSCAGGGASVNWTAFSDGAQYPISLVQNARNGISENYILQPPSIITANSKNYANFYTPALHTHIGFRPALGLGASRTSTLPYFLDPIDDRNGTLLYSGNPSYGFECLDEAFEVKYRIDVYARDWDTYADFVSYITTQGTSLTATPDRGFGIEGSECTGISGPCNDFNDIDDWLSVVSYDTTLGDVPFRGTYFPQGD